MPITRISCALLDTKRENAREKIRIKTLSLGVVIPDITFELAKKNEDMYLFSPYDVERVYGAPFTEISVSEKYYEMVGDKRIRKSKINARNFFQTLADAQFESATRTSFSRTRSIALTPSRARSRCPTLCSEILQASSRRPRSMTTSPTITWARTSPATGSMNIAKAMDSRNLGKTVETAVRALSAVSDLTDIRSVPSIERGNAMPHAIGLGQMNLHGHSAASASTTVRTSGP